MANIKGKQLTDSLSVTNVTGSNISASGLITGNSGSLQHIDVDNNAVVDGDLKVSQYIKHKGDENTFINFTDNQIRLNAGDIGFFDMEKDASTPYPATINQGGNRINFRVMDRNTDLVLKTDSEAFNVGLYHAGNKKLETTSTGIDVSNINVSASGHITASGNISASGDVTANEFNGIFIGALSSSAQISTDISGSFVAPSASFSTRVTTAETELANTLVSSSAQIADDISGSLSAAAIVGLGASIVSGSAQISTDISGSFTPASASFSTRITTAETELGNTLVSSSAQISTDISGSLSAAAVVGLGAGIISGSSSNSNLTTAIVSEGADILSGSAQIANDISGSLSAAAVVGLGANILSGSAQIANDVSGSLSAAAIVGLGAGIVSGSIDGTISGSAQIAGDISGSFTGELSGSHIKFVGGGVSGSAASTGSFGNVEASGDVNVAGRIAHAGDSDTRILFTDDDINITVGNVNMVDFTQDTVSEITFNEAGADVDFRIESDDDTKAVFIDASKNAIQLGTAATTHISASGNISGSASGSLQNLSVTDNISAANISASVVQATQGTIDIHSLSGYVANENIDHSGVTITAGNGLTGGGTIESTRTLAVGAGTGVTVNANDVAIGQDVATDADVEFASITTTGNITAQGDIIAENYIVSSSVTHMTSSAISGSSIFGDTLDDTHQFTGSVFVSGSTFNIDADGGLSSSASGSFLNVKITDNLGVTGKFTLPNIADVSASIASAVAGGDDMGNHTATQDLDMDGNDIFDVGHISSSGNISSSLGNILGFKSGSFQQLDANVVSASSVQATNLTGLVGTATQGTIDHDSLANFVANEHVDHTSITLTAGDGLSGGGTIAANRSFAVDATVLRTTGDSVVSSSAQLSDDISGSLSAAAVLGLGAGIISGSSSNSSLTTAIVGEGAGILSGSAQIADDVSGSLSTAAIVGLGANLVSASAMVDHDSTTNFVANEHINHTSVTLTAGDGLTGGGTIASNRTFAVGAGTGVTVNSNDVAIGQDVATTANVKFNHITGSGNISGSLGNILGFNSGSFQAIDALALSGSVQQATQALINHDSLAGFVSDEHIDHTGVTITAGAGLTGGGTIASTRTLAVGAGTGVTVNANDVAIGQDVATTANVKFNHITGSGNISGSAAGDILGFASASLLNVDAPHIKATSVHGTILTATQGTIDHDSLSNFVANEHIDHSSVSVTAGDGLTGGGTIAANRTINVVGGDGITANANDIAITAAQTTIESIYKSDLVIGEDDETQIDFETANEIHFDVDNSEILNLAGTKISGSQASTGSFGVLETHGNVNVTTTGRLGVGTDDPDYKLDVAGNAGFNEYLRHNGDSDTHIRFQANQVDISAGGNLYSYDGAAFNLTGHLSASGNISGSQIEASGDIIAFGSSDRELKDNIQPIENPLEKMDKIGGYTFIWNDKQSTYKGKDVGVVAQEIQEVLPEIVSGRANGYLGVKYEKIVPLLIESIKELHKKIEDIEKNCDCLNK